MPTAYGPLHDPKDKYMQALMNGRPWGNMANLDPDDVQAIGVNAAMAERYKASPRRSSSGRTSSIQRTGGRKARQAHYTRKAILEREKEATRRALWESRFPGAPAEHWNRREAARKTRKAANRAVRKALKGRRSSSK